MGDGSPGLITRRRLLTGMALSVGGAAALSACGRRQPLFAGSLDIACGETGGTYIRFGRLLAKTMTRLDICRSATPLVTHGSVENLTLLETDVAQLALSLADSAADSPSHPIAIGRVYQNYLQCFVRADSDIRAAADLGGRLVSVGAPGSGTSTTSLRALDALGLLSDPDPESVVLQLDLATATARLASGEIDALMWSGGIPAPEITAAQATTELRLIDLSEAVALLNRRYDGVYQHTLIPSEVYGQEHDVDALGVPNFLLCRPDLPNAVAAALVDMLIDSARSLVPEPSAGVQYLTPSSLIATSPVPLHPGAARRYAERYG